MRIQLPALVMMAVMLITLAGCSEQKETKSNTAATGPVPVTQTSQPETQLAFSKTYRGTIDGKYGITMNLTRKGKELTGTYFYNKVKKPIAISGEMNAEDILTLEEKDEKGIVTGIFKGTVDADSEIEGEWGKPGSDKQLPFSLKEVTHATEALPGVEVSEYSFSVQGKEDVVADFSFPHVNGNIEAAVLSKINEQLSVQSLTDDTEENIKKNFTECNCGLVSSSYVVNYNKSSILSITVVAEWLGAYSSFSSKYMNLNTTTGESIKIEQLLNPSSLNELVQLANKLLQERIAQTRKEAAGTDEAAWVNELLADKQFEKANLENFTVHEKGITFHYPFNFPHAALALEPEGAIEFTFEQLQNFIKTDGLLAMEK